MLSLPNFLVFFCPGLHGDSDLGGLRWGLRFCVSKRLAVIPGGPEG